MQPELSFLVVGAGRAASTRIFFWLDRHPDVCMARPKEPQYFACHHDTPPDLFWPPFFEHYEGERFAGEATPGYLQLPYVPERIAATCPGAKIMMVLRHPVERAYSDWWLHHARGADREEFDGAMRICVDGSDRSSSDAEAAWRDHLASTGTRQIRARPYLEIGRYDEHLARYRRHFPADNIKVILFDDLRRSPGEVYEDLCAFLQIPAGEMPSLDARNAARSRALGRVRRLRHGTFGNRVAGIVPAAVRDKVKSAIIRRDSGRPPLPDTTRSWLLDYYRPHTERLAEMLGRDLSHWHV